MHSYFFERIWPRFVSSLRPQLYNQRMANCWHIRPTICRVKIYLYGLFSQFLNNISIKVFLECPYWYQVWMYGCMLAITLKTQSLNCIHAHAQPRWNKRIFWFQVDLNRCSTSNGYLSVILAWGKTLRTIDNRHTLLFQQMEKKDRCFTFLEKCSSFSLLQLIKKGVSDFRDEYIVQKVVCGT